jgi:sialidase-1
MRFGIYHPARLVAARRVVLGALIVAILVPASGNAEVTTIVAFRSGQDGYHTYRIPTIVRAGNGDLLAFAEGRKNGRGDAGDIDIVLKRSSDDGRTWSTLQMVQDEFADPSGDVTIGNPTPVVDLLDSVHRGRIWLSFTRNNDRVFVTYSDDHGASWTSRVEITSSAKDPAWGWYATGPVHGIQLTRGDMAGTLIIPCDHRRSGDGGWGAHILYSDDHGATWAIGAVDTHPATSPIHPNENVAVELVDGRIYINARNQNGSDRSTRAAAYSRDGGLTFEAPFVAEPSITTPVVQNSMVRFAAVDEGDDCNILVHSGPGKPGRRADLTIRISFDEGKTWVRETVLHPGTAAYSDLVKLSDERIGVLFETGTPLYQEIVFSTFELSDLTPDR